MYITIDETDTRALYQQVVDEIKALIVRGELEEDFRISAGVRGADDEEQLRPGGLAVGQGDLHPAGVIARAASVMSAAPAVMAVHIRIRVRVRGG